MKNELHPIWRVGNVRILVVEEPDSHDVYYAKDGCPFEFAYGLDRHTYWHDVVAIAERNIDEYTED